MIERVRTRLLLGAREKFEAWWVDKQALGIQQR